METNEQGENEEQFSPLENQNEDIPFVAENEVWATEDHLGEFVEEEQPPSQPTYQYYHWPYPNIGQSFKLVLFLFIFQFCLGFLFTIILIKLEGKHLLENPLFIGVVNLLAFYLVFKKTSRSKFRSMSDMLCFKSFPLLSFIPITIATAGLAVLLSEWVYYLFFVLQPGTTDLFANLVSMTLPSICTVVFIAPLTEEIFFRGLILKGLLKQYRAGTSIFISSLLFALFHLNLFQFVPAFVIGIFLGWLFYKTQSIWPCLFAHAIYNFFIICLSTDSISAYIPKVSLKENGELFYFQERWFLWVAFSIFCLGFYLLWRVMTASKDDFVPEEYSL